MIHSEISGKRVAPANADFHAWQDTATRSARAYGLAPPLWRAPARSAFHWHAAQQPQVPSEAAPIVTLPFCNLFETLDFSAVPDGVRCPPIPAGLWFDQQVHNITDRSGPALVLREPFNGVGWPYDRTGMARGDYIRSTPAVPSGHRQVERRLAAVLGADIMGYSAMMARAEEETHDRVGAELDRFFKEIEKSHGRVFTFAGDGLMAEFPSAVEALKCALRLQADMAKRNALVPVDQRILFRIGINSGEIMVQQDRTGGNAVNIAARLEAIAEPGGIALSEAVYQQVRRVVSTGYTFFGEQRLKNIRDPITIHTIRPEACSTWAGMPALPREAPQTPPVGGVPEYRASLAVLPFRTLQKDQSDAYFAEGIVDDIIRALGGLRDLLVIARSSTQTFARAPLDLRRVGHELDVRYVLHGSVRQTKDTLRIAVELCEAHTGTVIWVDRFDGGMSDLFNLQDQIAIRVMTSIAPHLRERELSRALRKHPENMTAYDLTLKALDLSYRMERSALDEAQTLLQDAVRHDPDYAPAYTHLAFLQMTRLGQGWAEDPEAEAETAGRAALAAIQRDRNDALALAYYGQYQSFVLKDFRAAQETHEKALAAGPNCAWAWGLSSLPFAYIGDTATAIARAERAVRLSPLGPEAYWHQHFLSLALYVDGRFDEAVEWGRASAALAPVNTSNICCLIASCAASGDSKAARGHAADLLRISPTFRLAKFRARTPLPADLCDRVTESLRQAGVPD